MGMKKKGQKKGLLGSSYHHLFKPFFYSLLSVYISQKQ